jgi:hypothetical protein
VSDSKFQVGDVVLIDERVVDGRDRVLPDELFFGDEWSKVAGARPHVAVG